MMASMMTTSMKAQSKISVQADDVRQQYVECPSCLKEYNEFPCVPRILPCLHALCGSCLESTASRGVIKCPTCNIRHNVPNADIECFRVDETRQYLVNYLKVQRKSPDLVCQECQNIARQVKHRCKECAQFLCADCTDAHRRTKVTKRHNIVGIDELHDVSLEEFQQQHMCPVSDHEGQPYAFYCYSDSCDRPVCALCAVADHQESRGHDIRQLNEVYAEVKRTVEGLMSDVKHRTLSAQDTANAIESTVDKLDVNLRQTVTQIDTAFESCVKALDRRRTELKDKAHGKAREKKKRLKTQMDSINFHINCMEDANEVSGSITTFGTQSEFLFFKDIIMARLNQLGEEEFDTIPHDNDDIKFKNFKTGEDFVAHTKEMGDVWTTSAYLPNTQVQMNDVTIDREQTMMHITLFDSEGMQQSGGGDDIRVDVLDPAGRRSTADVEDKIDADGRYKVTYEGSTKGKHRASVILYGTQVPNEHVFRVRSPHAVERLNLREKFKSDKEEMHSMAHSHAHSHTQSHAQSHMATNRSMHTATPSDASDAPISDFMIGDIICPEFVFDANSSNNSAVEITEEGKTMRAKPKGARTHRSGHEVGRFSAFRGAMASRPIQKSGLYYFEVGVVFKIPKLIRTEHIFEIGLAKLDCIDKYPTVDCHPYAWCVSARGCHVCGKVCLQSWHNTQLLAHSPICPRTKIPVGSFIRLYYGFLLDAERRHWIIVDVKNKKLIFRFKNLVVSEMSEALWPVFSVYSPDVTQAAMTLKTGRVIDAVPEEAVMALAS